MQKNELKSRKVGKELAEGDTALIITDEGDMNLRCPDVPEGKKITIGTLLLMAMFHKINTDKAFQKEMLTYFNDHPEAADQFGIGRHETV